MEQAVHAAQVDEGAVLGDVLHHAVDDLALLRGSAPAPGAVRRASLPERCGDTTILPRRRSIFSGSWETAWSTFISGVTSRIVRMSTRERGSKRDRAVEIDREAALDLVEDDALHLLVGVENALPRACPSSPRGAPCRARIRLAERVLDALEIDLDLVADLELAAAAGPENSRTATRPSVFAPTSISAMSFSIPTTVPLTTVPSSDCLGRMPHRASRRNLRAWARQR